MAGQPVAGEQLLEWVETYLGRTAELTRQVKEHPERLPEVNGGLQLLINGELLVGPLGLRDRLNRQIERLVAIDAHQQVGMSADEYQAGLDQVIGDFTWSPDLAGIRLTDVALVDFRLRSGYIAEAGEVYCYYDADACPNYDGVVTPDDRAVVIQGQWGPKYRNKKPLWCRSHFHPLEQGLTVKEGLFAYFYEGRSMLDRCYPDLPGSVGPGGVVPCLCWSVDGAELGSNADDSADPDYGSASRGS